MASVDTRLEDLQSQLNGSSNTAAGEPSRPVSHPPPQAIAPEPGDIGPLLRTMKLEVPKFDRVDPNGWAFRRASAWYQWMKANDILTI
ncbi:hypothetical protein JRO89_XS09G0200300 [Xanthoceras sorbifolium]|uniref:Uncharacterized protein n=1 Tax=Xanthoceras sorbifolium TaxID=99658 RepID=A0ABQ8HM12_9ROSI|nr:hypothetical protein JRO89_XS09G0200300 [Xanthoceras sorbifolium]